MKFNKTFYFAFGIALIASLATAAAIQAQDASNTLGAVQSTATTTTQMEPPVPMLFEMSTTTEMERPSSSTRPIMPPPERETASGTREKASGTRMLPPLKDQDEDTVASTSDTPATRLKKLAKYWAVYRELGSEKMYAITTSGTKREIQTLTFFTKIDSNFGMRLMSKGSLDQFTTGEPITSVEGLDLSSFRKLAQPCRLIKTADKPVVYLACLGVKRAILSEKAFKLFGWDFKHVQVVPSQDADAITTGDTVSESTVFDQGIQIEQSMQPEKEVKQNSVNSKPATSSASTGQIQTKGARVVKVQGSDKIFIITTDGKRHRLTNMDVVKSLKIDLSKLQVMTTEQLSAYPEGDAITLGNSGKEPVKTDRPVIGGSATGTGTSTLPLPPMPVPVPMPLPAPVVPVVSSTTPAV